jgi:hypothetical protein
MNTFEILVRIALALVLLYILWHGYVVVVAYRWKQQDKLISRALAPREGGCNNRTQQYADYQAGDRRPSRNGNVHNRCTGHRFSTKYAKPLYCEKR